MTFDGKSRLLISLVLACLITLALLNHWKRQAREKKEASTYEKVLLVLEETNTALMQVGQHSTKIYAPNSIACTMFGYTFREMDGMDVSEIIPDWYKAEHEARMKTAMATAEIGQHMYRVVTMDCMAVRKDKSEINVFVRVYIGKSGAVAFINLSSATRFSRMPKPGDPPTKP